MPANARHLAHPPAPDDSTSQSELGNGERPVVYFGDGPWDAQATASPGWRFIGVGPRLYGKCDNWIADFLDPGWPLSPNGTV